jgi:hypothetical protein
MMNRLSCALIAAVLLTGLATACGDDDTGDGSDGTAGTSAATTEAILTTNQFLEQVNAMCLTAAGRRQQSAEQVFVDWPETTPEQRETFVRTAGDMAEDNAAALLALNPPEDIQDEFDEYLAESGAALDELTADPDLLLQDEDPFAAANALAIDIGLTRCAGEWTPAQPDSTS